MSEAQLLTVDFLGIGIDKLYSRPNLSPAIHSKQSCLRKIKPHMLQQVLSHSHSSFSINPELEVSESIKSTMDLFPQHTTGFQPNSKEEGILDHQSKFSGRAAAIHLQPSPSTKLSSAQLTIFYNGAINVYDDVSAEKAENIIMLAAANTSISDQGAVSATLSNISNSLSLSTGLGTSAPGRYIENHGPKKPHAEIPIAKKLSLQRFLQKRNERINNLFPYTTASK